MYLALRHGWHLHVAMKWPFVFHKNGSCEKTIIPVNVLQYDPQCVVSARKIVWGQLVENAVDWALEDRDLLSIRGRAHFSRTLPPLNRTAQIFWEYLNYGLALLGLLLVWLIRRGVAARARLRYEAVLHMGRA